jgi:hypothetical protein
VPGVVTFGGKDFLGEVFSNSGGREVEKKGPETVSSTPETTFPNPELENKGPETVSSTPDPIFPSLELEK